MRIVHGFACRNCADEELAKRGIDPARPKQEFSGSEVYVPPPADSPLGENRPATSGHLGRRLDLRA
jgi:hypothetical protein